MPLYGYARVSTREQDLPRRTRSCGLPVGLGTRDLLLERLDTAADLQR
jgi:hypothetical protein